MKRTLAWLIAFILFAVSTTPVQAVQDPALFSCLNPVGSLVANYATGVHGIPGDSRAYSGSDIVYKIDDTYVLQCFCPSDANTGIQSNWWRANDVSEEHVSLFVRRGWIYVPNGKVWGLGDSSYLVQNESYTCRSGQGGAGSTSSTGIGGQTAETSGYVLGAATLGATGTQTTLMLFASLGILSALLAWIIAQS